MCKVLRFSSLKRLQVVDLMAKRETFLSLNYSVPTDDFLDVINEFAKEFDQTSSSAVFAFTAEVRSYISEIITHWGLCFTFNIALSRDLLNQNSTSSDFHYELFITQNFKKYKAKISPPEVLPRRIPTSNAGLLVDLFTDFSEVKEIILNNFDGYFVLIHDPFELPSKKSKIFQLGYAPKFKVIIDAELNKIDESIRDYQPAE